MKKKKKEKMNLKEFTTRINLLTNKQQLMIKPQIYYNPDHIHYYDQFNKGNYEFCIDYLNENIELLNASKITNESMTRQERRENMKEINEALKKLNEKPVKLTQEQQDYIITNSKVLFGFQIKASSLYDQNDFTTLPEELSGKVINDVDKIKDALQLSDDDTDTELLNRLIKVYCLLINGYNFNGWTNIYEIKSIYNNVYEFITNHKCYVKFEEDKLDKIFYKINKDIERELKHKTWDEEKEEDKEYRENVCPNYDLDFGNEDLHESDEDIIKPSITDIPESVEEMLKNADK